jgi:Na+-transporting NADH:ubiquinone oxidoreductase subunit NqrB
VVIFLPISLIADTLDSQVAARTKAWVTKTSGSLTSLMWHADMLAYLWLTLSYKDVRHVRCMETQTSELGTFIVIPPAWTPTRFAQSAARHVVTGHQRNFGQGDLLH